MAEPEQLDAAGDEFAAKPDELAKAVSRHAEREEAEEFPAVRESQPDQQLRELGEKLLASLLDRARDAHQG